MIMHHHAQFDESLLRQRPLHGVHFLCYQLNVVDFVRATCGIWLNVVSADVASRQLLPSQRALVSLLVGKTHQVFHRYRRRLYFLHYWCP